MKYNICLPYRYIGHLKERSLKDQLAKDPTEVIRKAVLRMLPRNKLRDVSDFYVFLLYLTGAYNTHNFYHEIEKCIYGKEEKRIGP